MEKVYAYKNLFNLAKDADAFLVETEFSSFSQYVIKKDELENLISKLKEINKKVYLRCDRILLEDEIIKLNEYKEIFLHSDGIFFEDFAFVEIFKNHPKKFKLVFFPFESFNTLEEAKILLNHGIDIVILPHGNENLLDENSNCDKFGISCIYNEILFMSRRKLLSLKDIDNNETHFIQESTRLSKQIIKETNVGTLIYNEKKEIIKYPKNIAFLVYDTIFIEEN